MTSKPTNAGIDLGAMPAKLFENVGAIVTAGLAKLVDDVNQYAAPMYAPTANGATDPRPERATPKITSNRPAVATASASQIATAGSRLRRPLDRGQREHEVGEDRTADSADDLRGDVDGEGAALEAAERRVGEAHDRVEMGARHRSDREDDRDQPGRGRGRVLEQLEPGVAR